ncbi:MAG TPA: alpha/beta hydrolase [Herbaspirillum sp.]|jgi:pimeloyl-ACP methyl ester carboxylesterase
MNQASLAAAQAISADAVDRADCDGLTASLALMERRFAQRIALLADGQVSYRECGKGPAIVLLHGIGSGGASWLHCALALESEARVIAWDAPGYGASTPLAQAAPSAADYAARLEQLLATLEIERCLLVGHSLGAMMAAAYVDRHAADGAARVTGLLLASPAQGYGAPEKRERAAQVIEERLGVLTALGIAGMAEQRSARTVSSQAGPQARAWARWNMSRLDPAGYTQAVRMLAGDDIRKYLIGARQGRPPVSGAVFCGSLDTVTTPADSRALATACNFPFVSIDGAGHACYVEQPALVARAIREAYPAKASPE